MVRRLTKASAVVVAAFAALVGIEVVLAMRRDYLPTQPALQLGGDFGSPADPPLRFVVLGDSTAAGVGVGSAHRAYPTLLAEWLAASGRHVDLSVFGVSGARTKDVLEEQVPRAVAAAPDLIFVAIGANDVIHVTPLGEIEEDMAGVIARLQETGAIVVVAGPPDMRARAFHEPLRTLAGWRGHLVEAAIRAAADSRSAPLVALAEGAGPFFGAHPDVAYSADEFHPGPEGYERWARVIYPVLIDALEQGPLPAAGSQT